MLEQHAEVVEYARPLREHQDAVAVAEELRQQLGEVARLRGVVQPLGRQRVLVERAVRRAVHRDLEIGRVLELLVHHLVGGVLPKLALVEQVVRDLREQLAVVPRAHEERVVRHLAQLGEGVLDELGAVAREGVDRLAVARRLAELFHLGAVARARLGGDAADGGGVQRLLRRGSAMRSVSSVFGGSEPSTSDFRRRSTKGAISLIRRAPRRRCASSPSAPAPARSRSAKVWTSAAALLWPRFRFFPPSSL